MPELPDITVYVECLERRLVDATLQEIKLRSPFVLRTVLPPWREAQGKRVTGVRRLGKRIVVALEGDLRLVLHLMRLGRLRWADPGGKAIGGKILLATFGFDRGSLYLTETGTKKRASLHIVSGDEAVQAFHRGGIDLFAESPVAIAAALRARNHTIKRALTDPRIVDGIGNAYSDEILHAAQLSPVKLTSKLDDDEVERLVAAARRVIGEFTDRMRHEVGDGFPTKVTAFRDDMAVHGKYKQPCPVCGAPVQRIVYSDRETNYCAKCQTGGRRLADRALSRLLGKDWPRTLEDLEEAPS
jgi:formamidopyrimidine-DNA glycosylase